MLSYDWCSTSHSKSQTAASIIPFYNKNVCHHLQKRLNGYKFPVYTTDFCPENRTEWKKRSAAFNCTKETLYSCFPNENLTMLLEFCYPAINIPIEEGNTCSNDRNWTKRCLYYFLLSAIKMYTHFDVFNQK